MAMEYARRFAAFFNQLNKDTLSSIPKIYHSQVCFIDPVHRLNGLDDVMSYFQQMYENVESCHFEIESAIGEPAEGMGVYWTMTLVHRRLNGRRPIEVPGCSHLRWQDDKLIYHRDYFDLGGLLYERIPLLGSVVRAIKSRVASS